MGKRQLLIDSRPFALLQLTEDSGSGRLVAKGEFALADEATDNRRIYPRKIWERELSKLDPEIKQRKVYGELDHPADGKTRLANVSHILTSLEVNDKGQVIGEAEILNTKQGLDLQAIQQAGGKVGVSSRGFGSVVTDEHGNQIVQDDYQLVTFDFVALPAVASSYPKFFAEDKEEVDDMADKDKEKKEAPPVSDVETKLREQYGDIIAQIEKKAEACASKKIKEEVEAELEQDKEKKLAQAKEDLKAQFKEDLINAMKEKEGDMRKKIEAEFEDDPEAGKAKDKEIGDLKQKLSTSEERLAGMEKKIEEASIFARKLGYNLFLERAVSRNEDREMIKKLVGDVSQFGSVQEIEERVKTVTEEISKKRLEEDRQVRTVEIKYRSEVATLRDEVGKLREALGESLNVAKKFGVNAFIERKIASHPRATKIRRLISESGARTQDQIEAIIEEVNQEGVSEEFKRVQARVRGREHSMTEEIAPPASRGDEMILGASVRELKRLSGEDE